jgi:hypothetical protein
MTRVFEPERSNTFGVRPRCRTMLGAGNFVWCDWKCGSGCAPILRSFNYTRWPRQKKIGGVSAFGTGRPSAKVAAKSVTT